MDLGYHFTGFSSNESIGVCGGLIQQVNFLGRLISLYPLVEQPPGHCEQLTWLGGRLF